ncbi:MAG: AI-2E family transporter, partial [Betaproteobacteria bacterium]|nr:AI-2E family transporter [Betaproteobacteria bacterium]
MQQAGVHRTVAIVLVVLVTFSSIGGVGYLVVRQVNSLVDAFPQYEQNLQRKIEAVQSGSGFIDKMQQIIKRVTRQVEKKEASEAADPAEVVPMQVTVIRDGGPFPMARIWSVFGPILEPFAAVGLAVVLVIFMLLRREDLRDRMISLVGQGHGRLTLTTKALDEAAERISRFLLMQLIINSSYGVVVGVGLYLIGVPFALLWGFFAAVFRYIPYLGPWLAAILPIGLSLLVSEGWSAPFMVFGLFLALELVSNMVIEPWLYGRGIGVSETATLIMIAFWTWLWGPIGLVLAPPLTVCVVVLGKYVPFLNFFDTLLGDRPALEAHVSFYQRMLARDQDEAAEIARNHFGEHSLEETYDQLLIPALAHAKRDVAGDYLSEDDQQFVLEGTRAVVEEIATLARAAVAQPDAVAGGSAVVVAATNSRAAVLA